MGILSGATAAWTALPRGVRVFIGLALYLLGYLFLDGVSEAFDIGSGVSVWYLPAALNLVLLVHGLRYLPAVFAAVLLAELINDPSLPLFASLIHALVYTLVYGGAALLLRRLRVNSHLTRLRDVGWFMFVGAFLAPLLVGFLSVINFALFGPVPWSKWLELGFQFAAGDATGVGALAPFLLVMSRYLSATPDEPRAREPGEGRSQATQQGVAWGGVLRGLLFAGLIALASFVAYVIPGSLTLNHSYITFIPVLFIAGWYGFAWGAAATLFVNVCIALFTFSKIGDVGGFALQFGLLTLTCLGILLSALTSERKWAEARLHHTAFHDALTGLPNRALFLERLARAAKAAARGEQEVAVLFIDLDRFKSVNDTLGHAAGDAVLVEAARRLRRCLRPGDTVARLGGDEFTALLTVRAPEDAVGAAERIQESFAAPFVVQKQALQLGASVGVALSAASSTAAQEQPEDLLRNADTALSHAKTRGRASYALFDLGMYTGQVARLRMESDLERALLNQELVVYYQPIVLLGSREIIGAEALLRWEHPERGLVPPDSFIPVAEETGLIVPIGTWMMEEAFSQLSTWHAAGHPQLFVSVNASARQAQHPHLVEVVRGALERLELPPSRVTLELTESVLMEGVREDIRRLETLYNAGIHLAIDDFGTGYSSLSYLKRLPVHTLKIDRSFLTGVPHDGSDAALVKTVLAMARTLNLEVIAEGVETPMQANFLRAEGCEKAQGYLFSPPVPAEVFTELLARVPPKTRS